GPRLRRTRLACSGSPTGVRPGHCPSELASLCARSLAGADSATNRLCASVAQFFSHNASAFSARRCENAQTDRKSTRLNSSHVSISYAVFCLKKKIYATEVAVRCVPLSPTSKLG